MSELECIVSTTNKEDPSLLRVELDNCEVCHGKRGGVLGNENIIAGIIMCDYCTSDAISAK